MWQDRRLIDLLGIEHPIIQAPMAGSSSVELAIAVAQAGGLGSLPCAMLDADGVRRHAGIFRQRTEKPLALNFFCHRPAPPDLAREAAWRARLARYAAELGADPAVEAAGTNRAPFDEPLCRAVEEVGPAVVSFHFGLPHDDLLDRVKATGAILLSSATTVAEARWLEGRGVHAIIAQGAEAGGHRGIFLGNDVSSQPGTFALVPQVVDAVGVPVIAAGGIADGRGVAAALMLGAAGVQVGTAYLFCPECAISEPYRAALRTGTDDATVLTNVFTGRPARGLVNRAIRELGPLAPDAPAFPGAAGPIAHLRKAAEDRGSGEFSPLWAGQAVGLGREIGAGELTGRLVASALALLPGRSAS